MSVQDWQVRDVRSTLSSVGSYNARYQTKAGLAAKQTSNPNPKIIPAPIPSNLVPYRKEESLKRLQEEYIGESVDNNPQYQEFLARRGKSGYKEEFLYFLNSYLR